MLGRHGFYSMDGMKVTIGSSGMTVWLHCAKERRELGSDTQKHA